MQGFRVLVNKMLRKKHIQKTYWALVEGCPTPSKATLEHFLRKNPKNNKSTAYKKEMDNSKKAILHYEIKKKLDETDREILELAIVEIRQRLRDRELTTAGEILLEPGVKGPRLALIDGGTHRHTINHWDE